MFLLSKRPVMLVLVFQGGGGVEGTQTQPFFWGGGVPATPFPRTPQGGGGMLGGMPRRGGTILTMHMPRLAWHFSSTIHMEYWWLAITNSLGVRAGTCLRKRASLRVGISLHTGRDLPVQIG